jgi:uncharacterized membrane protein (UPF0127 family)
MQLYSLKLKSKNFSVAIANTDELRNKGLSGLEKLGKTKGMLFVFSKPTRMEMVMQDMKFPLDFLFLTDTWEIIQTGSLEPGSNKIMPTIPVSMVLEINKGWIEELNLTTDMSVEPSADLVTQVKGYQKFKKGGKFEIIGDTVYQIKIDDIPVDPKKMQILDSGGVVVANVENGARIFSREHTKKLIAALKDKKPDSMADTLIAILDIQETQKPEYVTK